MESISEIQSADAAEEERTEAPESLETAGGTIVESTEDAAVET